MNGPTLSGWKKQHPAREGSKKNLSDLQKTLGIIRQAAASAEKLTGDPDWDAYLRMLQERVDRDQESILSITEVIDSEEYLTSEELLRLRHQRSILQAINRGRTEAMEIPCRIKREAENSVNR